MSERSNLLTRRFLVGFTGFIILWFAIWTIIVNTFVLAGADFSAMPSCLLAACAISLFAGWFWIPRLVDSYGSDLQAGPSASSNWKAISLITVAGGGAIASHVTGSTTVLIVA